MNYEEAKKHYTIDLRLTIDQAEKVQAALNMMGHIYNKNNDSMAQTFEAMDDTMEILIHKQIRQMVADGIVERDKN